MDNKDERYEVETILTDREDRYGKKPKKERKGLKYFAAGLAGALLGSAFMGAVAFTYLDGLDEKTISNDDGGIVQQVLNISDNAPTTVEAVAELVTPAVVGITTVEIQDGYWRQFEQTGVGSGVIVTSDGYILTNQHVVTDNPKSITVSLKDGRTFSGEKIWSDASLDLAIVKIEADNLPVARLGDSDQINVGELAVAIGNPLGLTFERTVTSGIISALNRSIMVGANNIAEDLIQTDASINSGNSGGPLLNKNGEVIGINTYKIDTGEGMGFAIPINIAKPIINQIVKTGEFQAVVMGVSCLDREIARYYGDSGIDLKKGILVMEVQPGSGASKAGLKPDDVILEVDGKEVNTMLKLREILYGKSSGQSVEVKYERSGVESTVQVELNATSLE
ncbi:S1C family serine protease [Alkalibacter mobilis]|uniref:S1C family serine protease n=1 Tax=Alkalibacter mobilis TaxID=2787712 RepID=UPI00189ED3F6|nr:trypsin-like peptidase domain-containing protein [Alkalibacter mobilis]MBF7096699.1 trypsin-like peptidase domain-containing protein [Alkalibacter mobilis]